MKRKGVMTIGDLLKAKHNDQKPELSIQEPNKKKQKIIGRTLGSLTEESKLVTIQPSNSKDKTQHQYKTEMLINDENGAQVSFISNFVSKPDSKVLFNKILSTCTWKTKTYNYGGKDVISPREFCGISSQSEWSKIPELISLKERIEKFTNHTFTYCFINKYKDGNDSIYWHSDKEKGLKKGCPIVSISLGR